MSRSNIFSFVWKAYCTKPSWGSVGHLWPVSFRYFGALTAAPIRISQLLQSSCQKICDIWQNWRLHFINLCPAPTVEVAIALVIGVASQVSSPTSLTNPIADKGLRMRAITSSVSERGLIGILSDRQTN